MGTCFDILKPKKYKLGISVNWLFLNTKKDKAMCCIMLLSFMAYENIQHLVKPQKLTKNVIISLIF